MTGPSTDSRPLADRPADDRLDSWKEIASYMKRDVTTVQRWEKREGMPVHRHVHDKIGSVYAFKSDLDAWSRGRTAVLVAEAEGKAEPMPSPEPRRRAFGLWLGGAAGALLVAGALWQFFETRRVPENPLADARIVRLTDFDGIEQAAAVSRDGRFVTFLSDRDGQMDVWITQVGTGRFYNLTRGSVGELINPSVRTLGFSPDGTLVTFWARRPDPSNRPAIGIWAVPVLGGEPRPYLEDTAEFDWTSDGVRLVYHTPGPGDPMFVRDSGQSSGARQIFSAPAGLHSHFPVWSPGQKYIYFVQGSLPDRMDIWRIAPTGGKPERITTHDSPVSHPVFISPRTLMYLASDSDGSGPWIHSVDIERRVAQRVSVGVDRYTSLAASADGLRVVATVANPKGTLWRLPAAEAIGGLPAGRRLPLMTGNGSSPRMGAEHLFYISSKGTGDSIWKLQGEMSAELWSAPDARVIGGPAISLDGQRIAFSIRQHERTALVVANADGTDERILGAALQLEGAPAWTPNGQAITVAVVVDGVPRLFNFPLNGGSPVSLLHEYSIDPVWSPDGEFVAFSGPDIGTTFEVKAVTPDGAPYELPKLTLTRGARHLGFISGRRLVVLRGEIQHKNLWVIDLETGAEHPLTNFAPNFAVRDFDISPDGHDIVLEQVQEHSDIVMLELPRR